MRRQKEGQAQKEKVILKKVRQSGFSSFLASQK